MQTELTRLLDCSINDACLSVGVSWLNSMFSSSISCVVSLTVLSARCCCCCCCCWCTAHLLTRSVICTPHCRNHVCFAVCRQLNIVQFVTDAERIELSTRQPTPSTHASTGNITSLTSVLTNPHSLKCTVAHACTHVHACSLSRVICGLARSPTKNFPR